MFLIRSTNLARSEIILQYLPTTIAHQNDVLPSLVWVKLHTKRRLRFGEGGDRLHCFRVPHVQKFVVTRRREFGPIGLEFYIADCCGMALVRTHALLVSVDIPYFY